MTIEEILFGAAGFFILLILGLPVAVVMVILGILGGLMVFGPAFVQSIGSVVWSVQNNNILTAIPLFILLGEILLRSGLADRMYAGLSVWLGRLPGGLLYSNIGACALFAATSGSSAATAATVGTVALPNLIERKYDLRQALGSLAAGGTLGILIPPSVALLVYGSLTETSISRLFVGAVLPGVLLVSMFFGLIFLQSLLFQSKQLRDEVVVPLSEKLLALRHLAPAFVVFGIVMGGIYFGWATPTEAAALGVMASLGLAYVWGKLNLSVLHQCFQHTAVLTGMIILIMIGAFVLNVTLSMTGIPQKLTDLITAYSITAGQLVLALVAMYIVLGCFLDVLSMQVTTIPIAYPVAMHFGIDPVWFGVFVVLVSEIAMITPPVGLNLYVVQSVRQDGGTINDVIVGSVPYVAVMLSVVALLWYVQGIVLWLPGITF